nr:hypothetical protein [uncultured Desulfobulbus sp.]
MIHIKYLYLHRVFNNSSLLLGGRSYGTLIQSLPNNPKRSKRLSKLRNRLLINGNETVELDFGSLHPSLLYNKYLGIDINGDLYNGFEDRSKAKYTLLTLLNCCDTDKINYTKSIDAIRKKLIDEGYRSEDGLTNVEIIKAIKFNELKHPNLVK